MEHLTSIKDIEQTIKDNRLCLFFIKAPDCGVCNVMDGKEVYRASQFIDLEELKYNINRYI